MQVFPNFTLSRRRNAVMDLDRISKSNCNWQSVWIQMCVRSAHAHTHIYLIHTYYLNIYIYVILCYICTYDRICVYNCKNQWGEGWFPLWANLKRGAEVAKGLVVQYVLAFRCIAVDSWPNWRLRICWSLSSSGLNVFCSSIALRYGWCVAAWCCM